MQQTIMMIHGMWGNDWDWRHYKPFFESKGYRCVTLNLRYHDIDPKSDPPRQLGTTSVLDYVDDVEKEIKQLDSLPILMGHSMGGLIAQILGSRGLAQSLVLLTPASPRGVLALRFSVIKSFWSVLTKWGFWRNPMRQTFDEAVYSMLHLLSKEEQRGEYGHFVYESGRAAAEIGFWLFDLGKATYVDESKVACPVLVIAGSEDRITPSSVVKKTAKKYGAVSTFKEFPNHSHWVIAEPGWEEIAQYIDDWLNLQRRINGPKTS
ncbi:MAG: alpha/beta hydrolase [Syntrophales bacterium]|jgi:non-heme chloroperoxidase